MKIDNIYLGDCISLMKKMTNKSVHLTLTDIPYAECNKESNGLRQINKGDADTINFDLQDFFTEILRITSGSIYVFCGIQQVSEIYRTFREKGMITRHCIWEKTNPSPMNGKTTWLSAFENCIFAKFPSSTFNENCKSNVWKHKSGSAKIHPTQKPLDLFSYLIEVSSCPKDIVFDPCIGSGTTALASIRTGRHFLGFELNEEWFKLASNRIKTEIDQDLYCLQRD